MAAAGSIVVSLLAATGSFETDIDRAARNAERRFREMEKTIGQWAQRGATAASVAVTAVSAWAVSMANTGRELDRLSAISNTSAESFQKWAHGAKTVGIEQEKLADIFKDMQDRVGEFVSRGGGPLKDFFDEIGAKVGVTAKDFQRLSGPEALGLYVQSLEKAGVSQNRMVNYMEAIASDSTALLPLLKNNAQGLRELSEQAERFGTIMSNEAVAAAVEMSRNVDTLTTMMGGLNAEIANQVLPTINQFVSNAIAAATQVDGIHTEVKDLANDGAFKWWFETSLVGLARVADVAVFVAKSVGTVGLAFQAAAADVQAGLAWIAKPTGADRLLMPAEDYNRLVAEYDAAMNRQADAVGRFNSTLNDLLVYQGNRLEQAALTAINTTRVVSDTITTVDLTVGGDSAGESEAQLQKLAEWMARLATPSEKLAEAIAKAKKELGDLYTPEIEARIRAQFAAQQSGAKTLTDTLRALIDKALPAQKALSDLHANLKLLAQAHASGAISATDYDKALQSISLAYARQVDDLLPESVKAAREQLKSAQDQSKALQQQIRQFGLADSAITRLTAAETRSALAKLESARADAIASGAGKDRINELNEQIEVTRRLYDLQETIAGQQIGLEFLAAQQKTWQEWERNVEQIFGRVGQSLTDAIFEGGKSAKDLLKDLFKSLVFNVVINPLMSGLQNSVTNTLGGILGYRNPAAQQGGLSGVMGAANDLSTLNTVYGTISQALTGATAGASQASLAAANLSSMMGGDAIGTLISMNGGWQGALSGLAPSIASSIAAGAITAAPTVAATMSTALGSTMATTTASYALGGAGAAAGGAAAGGATLMGTLGAALPWVGGALALASAFGLFGDREPTTRRGQRTTVNYAGGQYDIADRDSRIGAEAADAARALAEASVNTANRIFEQAGIDAAIDSLYAVMSSSHKRDKDGVGSGGVVRVGDQMFDIGLAQSSDFHKNGFGGWSDAEMLPRLATDIQMTVLEAFQRSADQMPSLLSGMIEGVNVRGLGGEETQNLINAFSLTIEQIHSMSAAFGLLPFENLIGLSFDATARLLELGGGIDALTGNLDSYYQNYYSEAERLEMATGQVRDAFGALSLEMPDSRDALRQLIEAQDLSTAAGQEMWSSLMQLQGAFAQVVPAAESAADATAELARAAQAIAQERMGLETQLLQLTGSTAELRRRELEALDPSNRWLQQRIWALQDEATATQAAQQGLASVYQAVQQIGQADIAQLRQSFSVSDSTMSAYRSAVQRLESDWSGLLSTISGGVSELRGQVEATAQMQYNQARAVISTALVTGQMPQTADLSEALRIAQQGVTEHVYASTVDQERAYTRLANEMEALAGIAQPELDAAQATLAKLEEQYAVLRGTQRIAGESLSALEQAAYTALSTESAAREQIGIIEQQLDATRSNYEALTGIRGSVDAGFASLSAALSAYTGAAAQYQAASPGGAGQSGPAYVSAADYLTGNPDLIAAYLRYGAGESEESWARMHWTRWGQYEDRDVRLQSFAVGSAFVPQDMTADIHRGEIIIDPRSSDILRKYGIGVQAAGSGNREVVAELQELRRQLARAEARLASIERSTGQLADQFDNVSAGGNALAIEDMASA